MWERKRHKSREGERKGWLEAFPGMKFFVSENSGNIPTVFWGNKKSFSNFGLLGLKSNKASPDVKAAKRPQGASGAAWNDA